MMLKDDYRTLFDSISPDAALEQRTRKEIMDMLHPKRKYRNNVRRAVCLVAAMLLLVGTAFAVMTASGILGRLFRNGEPSQQALDSIVRDSMQVSDNGVTLNMDEYLFDQSTLHLGWTVSSEREKDVFYTSSYHYSYSNPDDEILAEESIGGVYGAYGSGDVGDGLLVHLNGENPSHDSYAGYGYKSMPEGTINTRVIVHAYETDYELTDVESAYDLAFVDPGDPASLALEGARQIGVDANHKTAINGYNAYNEALQKLLADGMDWDAAHEAAFVESGIFKEVAVLELNVSIEPSEAAEPNFKLDGERTYELSDATVILKTLTVDTASTIVEYTVIPDKPVNSDGSQSLGLSYLFFDQDGNPLNAEYMMGAYGTEIDPIDGKQAFAISHDGNPLPETVTAITFVPRGQIERMENEPSNDYYLRVKEAADEDQCFTVELR